MMHAQNDARDIYGEIYLTLVLVMNAEVYLN